MCCRTNGIPEESTKETTTPRRARQKGGFLNVLTPALVGLGKAVALETDKRMKSYIHKAKQRHRRRR